MPTTPTEPAAAGKGKAAGLNPGARVAQDSTREVLTLPVPQTEFAAAAAAAAAAAGKGVAAGTSPSAMAVKVPQHLGPVTR